MMRAVHFTVPALAAFLATAAPVAAASTYAEHQARFLEEAAEVEAEEGDPTAAEQFRELARQARSSGAVSIADLPHPWQEHIRTGRRNSTENRDRVKLDRIERRIAGLTDATRERYAERVSHAQVDAFLARHELSEHPTLNTWATNVLRHAERDLDGIGNEADRDGDGILDGVDRCPDEPEDVDGYQDSDGCPDPDNDGDGIPDSRDKCPNEPETRNGHEDEDGCPDDAGDRDRDGISDARDRCPDIAESRNGVQDEDGCPELQSVHFASDSAQLDADAIDRMRDNSEVMRQLRTTTYRLEGHADAQNSDAYNYRLGQRRADAVKRYMVDVLGIEPERLETSSAGESKPVADNSTDAGRRLNRRVEFVEQGR